VKLVAHLDPGHIVRRQMDPADFRLCRWKCGTISRFQIAHALGGPSQNELPYRRAMMHYPVSRLFGLGVGLKIVEVNDQRGNLIVKGNRGARLKSLWRSGCMERKVLLNQRIHSLITFRICRRVIWPQEVVGYAPSRKVECGRWNGERHYFSLRY
jgi:hypothetical protein